MILVEKIYCLLFWNRWCHLESTGQIRALGQSTKQETSDVLVFNPKLGISDTNKEVTIYYFVYNPYATSSITRFFKMKLEVRTQRSNTFYRTCNGKCHTSFSFILL